MRVLLLHGPNLNLLGSREPKIYGTATLTELVERCRQWAEDLGIELEAHQSNHEGVLIDLIHDAIGRCDGIVINPGAFAHTSYALHDALTAAGIPAVEVHLSDISAREEWRAVSVTSPACAATFSGRGADGYRSALQHLAGTGG
jgi:3-dehydroquinate dehydratase-2